MKTLFAEKKRYLAFGLVILCLGVARFVVAPPPASGQEEGEPYRVELVQNDPYKVQTGLNMMAKRGWYYVSSIQRADGKVLLVFRK